MSPALANFLFEAANFLVLAGLLGWILFRPVRAALDRERERRESDETKATGDRAEAERLLQEALAKRERLDEEIAARRDELLAEARQAARQIREEARGQQAAELGRLQEEIESARHAEILGLAGQIGRIAGDSVRELLGTLDGMSLDRALTGVACRRLRSLPEAARRTATVETARPLEPDARRQLSEVLGEGFEERVSEDLGAGVRVTTPAGQVDVTAEAIARHAAEGLTHALAEEGPDTGKPGDLGKSDDGGKVDETERVEGVDDSGKVGDSRKPTVNP